jgi:UDP-N-acetylmuramoyl-L-alanyl-D-glutamate--2,6-diaminopimelate ligase
MRAADAIPARIGTVGAEAADVEITGLAYDSRRVEKGTLFFCVKGGHSDGHDHAAAAKAAGAAALVVERPLGLGLPEITVRDVRAAMGPTAARFYGDPTATLKVVGVTGTNGKTTTAYLVRALQEAAGQRCGLIGTVRSVVGGEERPAVRTTPEAIDLQKDFRKMLDAGEEACAIEVSSHALEQGRTDGVRFTAAIFTNLTRDHLDYHGTMEEYFQAKRRLFTGAAPDGRGSTEAAPGVSVINTDDPYGRRLAAEVGGAATFAVDREADYSASDIRVAPGGARFTLHTPEGERQATLRMPGRFNVANALGALAAVHQTGADLDTLVEAMARGVKVPGRFEPVEEGQEFAVVVDYAHTPDSLENVLRAARELTEAGGLRAGANPHKEAAGRVICVFGAGGDRDSGKRAPMGEAAAKGADVVFVTSDNPRSEDPEAIIEQVMEGAARARTVGAPAARAVGNRREAIESAIGTAREGDVLVIAGKGHEQGQEFANGQTLPFDDAAVAREALRARAAKPAGAAP